MKFKIFIFILFSIALHNTVRNGDPTVFFSNAYYQKKYSDEFSGNQGGSVPYGKVVEEIKNHQAVIPQDKPVFVPKFDYISDLDSPDIDKIFKEKVSDGKSFVWGNCTWFVAQYRNVDWKGHARNWLLNAEAKGHLIGKTPVVGAIMVIHGPGYSKYGHTGIVIKVKGDTVIVRDMNNPSLNKIADHEMSKDNPAIKGYIYSDADTQKNLIAYLKAVVEK